MRRRCFGPGLSSGCSPTPPVNLRDNAGRQREMSSVDRHTPDDLISQYLIRSQPYYRSTGREVELYEAAYAVRMPMMLKGPTGCGKTRFVEYVAWRLGKPLVTL